MNLEQQRFPTMEALNQAAAALILQDAKESVQARGVFHLVLSGGQTPRGLYQTLANPPFLNKIPWGQTQVWWGDERRVPLDHPHSNYRLATDVLLSRVPIPSGSIHPAAVDARTYEQELDTVALDTVLLGMGPDGHTASLFPGVSLDEDRLVVEVDHPQAIPPVPRISLTVRAINRARQALILISGDEKIRIADEIQKDPGAAGKKYPAARIRSSERTLWLIADSSLK